MKIQKTPASWVITFPMDDVSPTAQDCTLTFRRGQPAANAPRLTPTEVLVDLICTQIAKTEEALTDVLDGNSAWYEIQSNTGLPEERCKEISLLHTAIMSQRYP